MRKDEIFYFTLNARGQKILDSRLRGNDREGSGNDRRNSGMTYGRPDSKSSGRIKDTGFLFPNQVEDRFRKNDIRET